MRLGNYLTESKIEPIEEFTELVKRDCGKFLKEINPYKNFLYRGLSGVGGMGIKTPRADRMAKDMSLSGHEYLGNLFKKYHGWNARKEGVFCSGNIGETSSYGISYIVFPIDGYKYLWSDDIRDLFSCMEQDQDFKYKGDYANFSVLWNEDELNYFMSEYDYDSDDENDIIFKADKEVNNAIKNYKNNDLSKYLTTYDENELTLKCKKYYYIKWSDKNEFDLKRSLYK